MTSKKSSPQHGIEHAGGRPGNISLMTICLIYRRFTQMVSFTISLMIRNSTSLSYCHNSLSVLILNIAKIGKDLGTIVKVLPSSFGTYLSNLYIFLGFTYSWIGLDPSTDNIQYFWRIHKKR